MDRDLFGFAGGGGIRNYVVCNIIRVILALGFTNLITNPNWFGFAWDSQFCESQILFEMGFAEMQLVVQQKSDLYGICILRIPKSFRTRQIAIFANPNLNRDF